MGSKQSKPDRGAISLSVHDPMRSTERENLGAWHRYGIDVSAVYEVMEVIAQGHMGELTKVRRKKEERGVHNSATRARTLSEEKCNGRSRPRSRSPFSTKKNHNGEKGHGRRRPRSPFGRIVKTQQVRVGPSGSSSGSSSSQEESQHSQPLAPPLPPKPILKQASFGRKEFSAPENGKHTSFSSETDDDDASLPPAPPEMEENSDDDLDDSFLDLWRERMQGAKHERERMLQAMEAPGGISAHCRNNCSEHSCLGASHSSHRSVRFQRLYACKTVLMSRIKSGQMEQLLNEISIMRTLDHPYILRLYEVYQTKRKIWLITELCTGGDLTTRKLNEPEATVVIEQILRALTYMHRRGICHRNIKLEHILYEDGGKDATIRLIDFGLSQRFDRGEKSRKAVRTAYTLSPEIASGTGEYTEKTDIWAAGVVAWILLAGDAPFIRHEDELKNKEKLECLIKADYSFGITWKGRGITKYAKEFVRRCLQRRPEDRWMAKEALEYVENTWIPALESEKTVDPEKALKRTISSKRRMGTENIEVVGINMEDINRFCKYGRLKKTILMTMAQTMDREDVGRLREIFLAADTEENGTISLLEMKQAFQQLNRSLDDETVEKIFQGIDQDHSGQIHWAEFIAALSESYGLITLGRLAEAFDRIDSEGKGYISHEDLKRILGKDYDEELVDSMIEEGDFKLNGHVEYEELLQLMFEDPAAGMKAAGNITESLKCAGMGDITASITNSERSCVSQSMGSNS